MALQAFTGCRGKPLPLLALSAAALAASCLSAQEGVDLPAADRALQPQVEDVFRVGRIDGADWEIFGAQPRVAFDGAGNLHVFDPTSHRVVVLDPGGRFLRQIGRRGDGPGELRNPMGFAVMRDGTIVIADFGHAAFLVFGPGGEYERSVSFRGSDGFTALGELHADPRGGSVYSVGRVATMMIAGQGASLGGPPPPDRDIVRFDLEGPGGAERVYSAWGPPPPQPAGGGGLGAGINIRPQPRAFEPRLLSAALPNGGLVVSDSTGYRLTILTPDGRVERVLQRPLLPIPVTAQMERAERERRLADQAAGGPGGGPQVSIAGGGGGPGGGPGGGGGPSQAQIQTMMRQQLEQLEFYPELSVVTELATGWTGKIWVSRRGAGQDPTARGPVDVLTPVGEYLGTIAANGIRTPDAFGPDGLAAWIERDQFDTPIIAVRRLAPELR